MINHIESPEILKQLSTALVPVLPFKVNFVTLEDWLSSKGKNPSFMTDEEMSEELFNFLDELKNINGKINNKSAIFPSSGKDDKLENSQNLLFSIYPKEGFNSDGSFTLSGSDKIFPSTIIFSLITEVEGYKEPHKLLNLYDFKFILDLE